MEQSIYHQLVHAAQTVPTFGKHTPGETEGQLTERLLVGITHIDDAAWNALTPEAQHWYNQAVAAGNAKQPFPSIPGYTEQHHQPGPTTPAPIEAQVVSAPAATPVTAAVPAVVPEATSEATAPKSSTKRGIMFRARQLALLDGSLDASTLAEKLKAEGFGENISLETTYLCVVEVKNIRKAAEAVGITISGPTA